MLGEVGPGMLQTCLETRPHAGPPWPSGAGGFGRDADVRQQTLLFRVESVVLGALQIQPLTVQNRSPGKPCGGIRRTVHGCVIARPVVRTLPLHRPGDIPPRVQDRQRPDPIRWQRPRPGLHIVQPLPKPEGPHHGVLLNGKVPVFAHVSARMRQAGREGLIRLPVKPPPSFALRRLPAGPDGHPCGELVNQRAQTVRRSDHPHRLLSVPGAPRRPHALIRPREQRPRHLARQLLPVPGAPHAARNRRKQHRQISQPVRSMSPGVGDQALLEPVIGQQRGERDRLRVGHQLPRQDPPHLRIHPPATQAPQPRGPHMFPRPRLPPPRGSHRCSNLERLHTRRRATQQPRMTTLGLHPLLAPSRQPHHPAGRARRLHQPPTVQRAHPLLWLQVQAHALGPPR